MKLLESGEMYLETILILKNKYGYVRSIDIAHEMNYSKPSVSRAMSLLKEDGYIENDPHGMILLTEKGQAIAEKIYDRHKTLTKYLISLGVSEDTAQKDACRIEHVISDESFDKIKSLIPAAE
ncbi:MAG TPA: metal-dependent transcriptional regulator [Candidatus Ornithomonoglobus merdipullorum]|uniref:Metal-dependent transcriptional regulator n=1 Tax=Candidatus Ornithomonoglobus merdipullorum TaxID=2840895 RepID=A0A9D1MD63_9FIRM|nr:metal-dependent transcriptional regulator [Candidatus Ornithomonoglobus merdipullorum]